MDEATRSKHEYFMSLLTPVYDQVVKYVRAMVRDTEDARDILGETLLLAYETLDKLEREDSFRFYLFAIARRIFWKWKRRQRFFIPLTIMHAELPLTGTSPETHADVRLLYDSIATLPLKQAETFVLHEILGFSVNEIHAMQGGTVSGVKSRIARARIQLSSMLKDDDKHDVLVSERIVTQEIEL
jgi:RNA polymerase sigma-70 factor, ECF subfamily